MKFSAWYSIVVGVLMIGQWAFFLVVGAVPELQTEPIRIRFHLLGELVTALFLIVGGLAVLQKRDWAKPAALVAAGMLAYTAIVSPGYFAQQGQWLLVGMFAVILALDLISAGILLKARQ